MDERRGRRLKLIAALAVVLPILAGLAIAAAVKVFGNRGEEIQGTPTTRESPRPQAEAVSPAATGSPTPRVRLTEGGDGRPFDSASLRGEPYAVLFLSTHCEAFGGLLGRAAAELRPGQGAVLAISADPAADSPGAVRAFLARNGLRPGGPVHFLIGGEAALRGYWHAWGFAGPAPECGESVPAHLVTRSGRNAGVLDLAAGSPASLLTASLSGMAR
ncbi:MAG: hypothetical protein JSU06_07360 [Actinobacteria bacterium]|nr:hypothetical protein [Actinomycetota bacterium]